jgi:16S rRNA (guanine1207-N2)-methyltransferase
MHDGKGRVSGRLAHALDAGDLVLPDGRIIVIGAMDLLELQELPKDRLTLIVNFYPDHALLKDQGYDVRTLTPGDVDEARAFGTFDLALVNLPRAKGAVRAALALGEALAPQVAVNGAKDDGIESVLREVKSRAEVTFSHSKAHGKVFGYAAKGSLSDWVEVSRAVKTGDWWTVPGAFSADGPDQGSLALANALPPMKGRVADLGAGWGFLAANVLKNSPDVKEIALSEADFGALHAARLNITDPRASFHWGDAREADRTLLAVDSVIMNPPFHTSRAADPKLGQDFIRAAKGLLKRDGTLYMVANRQLPYEHVLAESFNLIEIMEKDEVKGFKLIRASGVKIRQRVGQKR